MHQQLGLWAGQAAAVRAGTLQLSCELVGRQPHPFQELSPHADQVAASPPAGQVAAGPLAAPSMLC